MAGEGEEHDGEILGERAKDEAAVVELDEAEGQGGSAADGVEGALVGAVGGQGLVVTVEDDEGAGGEERLHGGGLVGVGADGEEALPVGVLRGGLDPAVVKAGGGDVDGLDDRGGGDGWVVHGGGGGDDGDDIG